MTIWKYQLTLTDRQQVSMPPGAQILSAHLQHGLICLWAVVDGNRTERVNRDIEIFGTGNPIPHGRRAFIGSIVQNPFVWHVFERIN